MLGVSTVTRETETPNAGGTPSTAFGSQKMSAPPGAPSQNGGVANYSRLILPWITNELLFSTVLDMASGDGSAVDDLSSAKYEAHGIDLNARTDPRRRILHGSLFNVPMENGYFDLVICSHTLHEVADHEVPAALAEINRLSNSYVVITAPSGESTNNATGRIRSPEWWCSRLADFNWKLRLMRQDPTTGELVILAEKPDSMAAKVLPTIENGALAAEQSLGAIGNGAAHPNADAPSGPNAAAPTTNAAATSETATANRCTQLIDAALAAIRADDIDGGYRTIGRLADALGQAPNLSKASLEILKNIVANMERREIGALVWRLERELRPLTAGTSN